MINFIFKNLKGSLNRNLGIDLNFFIFSLKISIFIEIFIILS
jgi:hypothetical protein